MFVSGHITVNSEGSFVDVNGVIPDYDKLPIYEVEFIPIERRMIERCSPLQRLNNRAQFGDRRFSPGRRTVDTEMIFQIFV
ncbi:hypothetical protein SFSGTM_07210 [Sulfuriferula nivalis]|uniref:Uncharacterized protein n=1 Tax=Sulfuriferula nivalis TaxID=2675298 RepID=A0A809S7T1_9PROT|nr:hypothetical protein SFSGTM_07210 [Sulfuriferula nivalis]